MFEWLVEQVMKLCLGTALSGIAWVVLVVGLHLAIPFWIIWVLCVAAVFGIVLLLEHGNGHWDIF